MKNELMMRYAFMIGHQRNTAPLVSHIDEPIEDVVEELWEKDPDGYANLSEHIDLERYRDPRRSGQ